MPSPLCPKQVLVEGKGWPGLCRQCPTHSVIHMLLGNEHRGRWIYDAWELNKTQSEDKLSMFWKPYKLPQCYMQVSKDWGSGIGAYFLCLHTGSSVLSEWTKHKFADKIIKNFKTLLAELLTWYNTSRAQDPINRTCCAPKTPALRLICKSWWQDSNPRPGFQSLGSEPLQLHDLSWTGLLFLPIS